LGGEQGRRSSWIRGEACQWERDGGNDERWLAGTGTERSAWSGMEREEQTSSHSTKSNHGRVDGNRESEIRNRRSILFVQTERHILILSYLILSPLFVQRESVASFGASIVRLETLLLLTQAR
jgi:hypothetical protein